MSLFGGPQTPEARKKMRVVGVLVLVAVVADLLASTAASSAGLRPLRIGLIFVALAAIVAMLVYIAQNKKKKAV